VTRRHISGEFAGRGLYDRAFAVLVIIEKAVSRRRGERKVKIMLLSKKTLPDWLSPYPSDGFEFLGVPASR
jgi:hypothetical protein